MNTADKVISMALSQVGYLEKSAAAYKQNPSILLSPTAGAGSDNYTKYGKDMHDIYPSVMDFPAAWCDAFVDWCFYMSYGLATAKSLLGGNFDDYTVASANMYKKKNAWHTEPQPGDQIFFKNDTRINHTGLVIKVENGKVYTVEGNTSSGAEIIANGGAVCQKEYFLDNKRIAGYGRPKYDAAVKTEEKKAEWVQLSNGEWTYKEETGLAEGWREINGHWYYFKNNVAVKGYQEIGNERYYFETSGELECALLHTNDRGALVEWNTKGE